ncbi:hypothetical protein J32TS6_23330 [Virgibacillus pantothenticus]|uniref:IS110 family transposase n=1 Tax=Virgibacillus pantothenticus TaxID=1473 RepID=UPI001B251EBD|nr:transposase [Virgibacillus pantothenticus]MBU8567360.1 IS110 family transposase [Virgibacillus pantothenticus]MBU8598941.1 IS110 family transposase [Virgibacillus pantothenticus]MBU8633793.1 IS110 family transposase [Virgibacillus pantothenticus]MBU8641311.1 IS110 family transposase [Virgibacillus pantothenticus]MBU8659570.1 IS110 family transposase [Virgibacillus pantothenticus]
MEAMIERCAGLDVHQKTVVACVLYGPLDKRPKKSIESFSTSTKGLLELNDWLVSLGVTDVVMESTGVYWKLIWNILENQFRLVLANPKHVKNAPGRKADIKAVEWLAKLLRSGLIEGSFVPPEDIRDLRDLTRFAYNILKTGEPYQELGPDYVKQHHKNKELKMIEYLKRKGYRISSSYQQPA